MKRSIAFIICCGLARAANADATTQPTTQPGVVATVMSFDHIQLTWPAVSNIDYYRVCRGENPGFMPDYFSEVSPPGLLKNEYHDVQNVDAGTTYYYQVYAFPSGDNAPPLYPIVIREPVFLGEVNGTTPGIRPTPPFSEDSLFTAGKVLDDLKWLGLVR